MALKICIVGTGYRGRVTAVGHDATAATALDPRNVLTGGAASSSVGR